MSAGGTVAILTIGGGARSNAVRPGSDAGVGGLLVNDMRGAGRVSLEEVVRPWIDPITGTIREPKAPDLVLPEAFIEWGGPSEFTENTFRSDAGGTQIKEDDDDDKKPPRVRHNFTEEGRSFKDYKIVSKQDSDAYIVLRVATVAAFNGPNGDQFTLRMNPDQPGDVTGNGQTPPAPPALDQIGDDIT